MPAVEREATIGLYLNAVTLAGRIGQYGVKTSKTENTPHATFALAVEEMGFDEKLRTVYLDIETWGKATESATILKAGEPVAIDGKLVRSKRKRGDDEVWTTTVQAWRIQRLETDAL